MPAIRRYSERRRRVLYQAHVAAESPAGTSRLAAELREAREPASQFGSRVNLHLRGRWFSLVPVSLRAMIVVAFTLIVTAISLACAHHFAVTWPSLIAQQDLARPLRLDRPDSFGAWWLTMNWMLCAGASYLIYGLRLHRRDDYRGHYQLWRLTTIVLLVACIHSVVGLVGWLGAFLDLALGDRAVLSGGRWLRILLDVGGIILFMRLIHEVYRCRPALVFLLLSAACFSLMEAAAWNIFVVNSLSRSTIVLSAPFIGCSMLTLAFTTYLRLLFRQVRNIADGPSLRERIDQWKSQRKALNAPIESNFFADADDIRPAAADLQVRQRPANPAPTKVAEDDQNDEESYKADDSSDATLEPKKKTERRRLFDRFKRKPKQAAEQSPSDVDSVATQSDESSDDEDVSSAQKRKWFRLPSRAKKADAADLESAEDSSSDSKTKTAAKASEPTEEQDNDQKPKRKGWFSLRLKPPKENSGDDDEQAKSQQATEATPDSTADAATDEEPSEPKLSFFAKLKAKLPAKKPKTESDSDDDDDSSDASARRSSGNGTTSKTKAGQSSRHGSDSDAAGSRSNHSNQATPTPRREHSSAGETNSADDDDNDYVDEDDIDWDSMSKAERRRMRKKLRRGGRAA
ncbi:hypothetical protein LOC67_06195 [Stieleria sp. JC731]|uniref:DUF3488 domain-containing protein n=1 Tax=Pirellulaceae TaxID=2691357 RepID=UPI001E638247|nr:hypothetical protein [Stieleria sp. JC731]MCC9600143.1 hypothetical protein [Stieleria sp. JC731]